MRDFCDSFVAPFFRYGTPSMSHVGAFDERSRARRDQYGNIDRYWAKIWFNGPSLGWITDVYLVRLQ